MQTMSQGFRKSAIRVSELTFTIKVGITAILAIAIYSLYLFATYDSRWIIVAGALCLGILIGTIALMRLCKRSISKYHMAEYAPFVLGFLMLGVMYLGVFTPGNVPDGMYHFNSTYKYSNLILGQPAGDDYIYMRGDFYG